MPDPLRDDQIRQRTAILRIRTPSLPPEWDRPAGVYIGNEIECAVIDSKTREVIAILDQVQKITIEVVPDDIVRVHVETDAVEFEVESEGTVESAAFPGNRAKSP